MRWASACFFLTGCVLATVSTVRADRVEPGAQPDGTTLLHNLWPIKPVGAQVPMGNFPTTAAVDPKGRYVAVLLGGYTDHEIQLVDAHTQAIVQTVKIHEAFAGLAFSGDGSLLACGGGSYGLVQFYPVTDKGLGEPRAAHIDPVDSDSVVSGVTFSPDSRYLLAAEHMGGGVAKIEVGTGKLLWTARVDPLHMPKVVPASPIAENNDVLGGRELIDEADFFHPVWDRRHNRAYVSEWGRASVAVIDLDSGQVTAHWACGLHPNELLLSDDGRLFVSNGGVNSVTVFDTATGSVTETLVTAIRSSNLPGVTPDSLALSRDQTTLFVANAYTNDIAVFDVGTPRSGRPIGFIPTGWFPTAVRVAPNGRTLYVVSARGLSPHDDAVGWKPHFRDTHTLYVGTLGFVPLPKGDGLTRALAGWTATEESLHPAPIPPPEADNPIPLRLGQPSAIKYVIYAIKENRTYDQVLGDMKEGNGDPSLVLFGQEVTPNQHALARAFVLLDNLFANAEESASGHEWSMAGYSSEFLERTWPAYDGRLYYGRKDTNLPYAGEGHFKAALPSLGYLWDQAAAAGVTYRSYGEFAVNGATLSDPVISNMPALKAHIDPRYRGWDQKYKDVRRMARFIDELHRFEREGEMPRLQILRLPQDHTAAAVPGNFTPKAMVSDNDLAVGQLVEAVSHSKFWPQTAIFVIEDDSQNGPDHVDAHRTTGYIASPYIRRGSVDSTPYTSCSMLHTMELILGIEPMSQFDAAAMPMYASFTGKADLTPYTAVAETENTDAVNVKGTRAAQLSRHFDLSKEDNVDDLAMTRAVWKAVRGDDAEPPAPVHAAFVHPLPKGDDDDDD